MSERKYYKPDMILTGEVGEINLKAWDDAVAVYEDCALASGGELPQAYLYGFFDALVKERSKHLKK